MSLVNWMQTADSICELATKKKSVEENLNNLIITNKNELFSILKEKLENKGFEITCLQDQKFVANYSELLIMQIETLNGLSLMDYSENSYEFKVELNNECKKIVVIELFPELKSIMKKLELAKDVEHALSLIEQLTNGIKQKEVTHRCESNSGPYKNIEKFSNMEDLVEFLLK